MQSSVYSASQFCCLCATHRDPNKQPESPFMSRASWQSNVLVGACSWSSVNSLLSSIRTVRLLDT
eukprot:scaffold161634_cov27-Tisochrysis_lutea.AAC.1